MAAAINQDTKTPNKTALDNPLPAPSRIRKVATNLNLSRRGAHGSGCQAFYVPREILDQCGRMSSGLPREPDARTDAPK